MSEKKNKEESRIRNPFARFSSKLMKSKHRERASPPSPSSSPVTPRKSKQRKGSASTAPAAAASSSNVIEFDFAGMELSDLLQLLHYQAEIGHDFQSIYKLLRHDKRVINKVDQGGRCALHLAVMSGSLEVTLLLLMEGADANQMDKFGWTPLHFVGYDNNQRILKGLLEFNDTNVNLKNKDGNSALHYIARKTITPENLALFKKKGVNMNAQNNDGETPLHHACCWGDLPTTKLLVEHGADIKVLNNKGESCLHWAARTGRTQIVEYLVSIGADTSVRGADGLPVDVSAPSLKKILRNSFDIGANNISNPNLDNLKINKDEEEFVLYPYRDDEDDDDDAFLNNDEETFTFMAPPSNPMKILQNRGDSSISINNNPTPINNVVAMSSTPTGASVLPSLTPRKKSKESVPDFSKMRGIDEFAAELEIDPNWLIDKDEIEFVEKIGSGTSSKVYRAVYRSEEVAVKILKNSSGKTKAQAKVMIDDFLKEFKIMSAVRSPYVIFFYGVILDPAIAIVMQYFPRKSLNHVMREDFFFGWDLFFKFARDSILCVNCLHSWKPQIVHRDLKSLNLLVDEGGSTRICDFGLSRFTTSTFQSTLGKLRGTFAYCAPELYYGETYNSSCDIYSFGIILWELATRVITGSYQRPFSEFKFITQDLQIIIQTAKNSLRPTIPISCPESLVKIIRRCWEQEPKQRPEAKEVIGLLRDLQVEYEENIDQWNKCIESVDRESRE